MLTRISYNVAIRIYPTLSEVTQQQLCNPTYKASVAEFYGLEKHRLLTHAIIEIDHNHEHSDNGQEFFHWVGLTEEMRVEIKRAMIREGWSPGKESME